MNWLKVVYGIKWRGVEVESEIEMGLTQEDEGFEEVELLSFHVDL
jgi:hypothetical protein